MPDAGDAASNTPKEALVEWAAALEARDKRRLLAALHVSDETREFLEALADAMFEAAAFHEAFGRAYGPEALAQFREIHQMEAGLHHTAEQLAAAEIVEQGDLAAATLEGHTYKLVRVAGRWVGEMADVPPGQADAAVRPMRMAASVLAEVRGEIGLQGATPQDIANGIAMRMMAAMPEAIAQAIPPPLAAALKSVPPEAVEALKRAAASAANALDCFSALPPDLLAGIPPDALHALQHLPPEILQSLSPDVLALLNPADSNPPDSTP